MSILTHDAIVAALKNGEIVVDPPLDPKQIREASIDLRLGTVFRVFEKKAAPIPLHEETDYKHYTKEITTKEITIRPQETILGVTEEKITLPGNICAWIEGRSRFARLGLLIHISAGIIQPGIDNHQVLEITNLSPNGLVLYSGEKICQLVFERTEGSALYLGKFQKQTTP